MTSYLNQYSEVDSAAMEFFVTLKVIVNHKRKS